MFCLPIVLQLHSFQYTKDNKQLQRKSWDLRLNAPPSPYPQEDTYWDYQHIRSSPKRQTQNQKMRSRISAQVQGAE